MKLVQVPNKNLFPFNTSKIKNIITSEWFIIGTIILLGCVLRLIHLFLVGFNSPFRYGGLYMEFSQQIIRHQFALPQSIPFYTESGIPFAYPPLPFYIQAVIIKATQPPKFAIVNLLPPLIAVLTLPAFYFLLRNLELNFRIRVISMFAFATMSVAYTQQIEGAGLSEAMGSLALICMVIAMIKTNKVPSFINYIIVGILWALCILASPGSAYASVFTFVFFAVTQLIKYKTNSIHTFILLLVSGLVALIVSCPYWFTVIRNHGIYIFIDTLSAQQMNLFETVLNLAERIARFQITGSMFLWNLLLFCGLIYEFINHRWILPIWFFVLLLVPRESGWLVSIPASILAGIGGSEVLIPPLLSQLKNKSQKTTALMLVFLLIVIILGSSTFSLRTLVNSDSSHLTPEAITAMEWIDENIASASKLIVISDSHVLEWAPQITQRTVINVPYGAEWEPEERYKIDLFNASIEKCNTYDCILNNLEEIFGFKEIYLLTDKNLIERVLTTNTDNNDVDFKLIWNNGEYYFGYLSSDDI